MLQTFWGLQESAPNVLGLAGKVLQTAPAAITPLFLHLESCPSQARTHPIPIVRCLRPGPGGGAAAAGAA
eukprot:15455944-Alexandrium_andersonii.AAC.1